MNSRPVIRGGSNTMPAAITPGDWHVSGTTVYSDHLHVGVAACEPDPFGGGSHFAPSDSVIERQANATLIAMAPKLLALAELYRDDCCECAGVGLTVHGEFCKDCEDIREVIAQAKGQ